MAVMVMMIITRTEMIRTVAGANDGRASLGVGRTDDG